MPHEGRRRRRAAAGLALLLTTTVHATRSRPNLRHKNGASAAAADSDGRDLSAMAYCGSNWQDAFDTCDHECEQGNDSKCGPGRYCFGYVGCTPPPQEGPESYSEPIVPSNFSPAASPNQVPSVPSYGTPGPNYMPAYIASLPVAPSEPTTPAPFVLPPPTMNVQANPTNNFCGYGWEHANSECFHACPSGKDSDCPGGRSCHGWLQCTQASTNPAEYNVCGKSWAHAASSCGTRCFQGNDDACPPGQSCFGGVTDCDGKLPTLTAVDAGLVEKSYTEDEIKALLDEEIARERDEVAMSDSRNWWCGSSWSEMLEKCSKRCTTDDDCKSNAWDQGKCFKTTGGPENCSTPGVAVKDAVPEGSRWCGQTWNSMLETCAAKCTADEDCTGGQTCWEAPGTCQWVGVPVKEKSDPATLWCGTNYDDAMSSCHRACPGEGDDECPPGMSCFSGSACTEEGVEVVREGYRCGTSWSHASETCGRECQGKSDCEDDEECFKDVVCASELAAQTNQGMYCGTSWDDTGTDCSRPCGHDDDCEEFGQWCYWVECETKADLAALKPPEEEEEVEKCSAEVNRCPNGQYVGRAQQLNCDFYPCPSEEEVQDAEVPELGAKEDSQAAEAVTDMSNWGTKPLAHACSSDGQGSCGMCEGDCNNDADCEKGLMCFSRGQGDTRSVPGCVSGGSGDKAGMDYCYTPFPPATTTSSTTTTTTTTSTTTTAEIIQNSAMVFEIKELGYVGECSAESTCGNCEGDCDNSSHCADGLLCFSRGSGSVQLVPGCTGLGVAGMDYCYDPNASIVLPPTEAPSLPPQTGEPTPLPGCSAEVRVCPDGSRLYQDRFNNCEFPECPIVAPKPAPTSPAPTEPFIIANSQAAAISDSSFSFCGFSLTQVNRNCATARTCYEDRDCSGMEVCISGTDCGGKALPQTTTTTSTSTTTATTSTGGQVNTCDELCLDVLPPPFCPADFDLPNCLEIGLGEICESNGECATDDTLNNCGTFDIYVRVKCGGAILPQGVLMQKAAEDEKTSPPSARPTALPTPPPQSKLADNYVSSESVTTAGGMPSFDVDSMIPATATQPIESPDLGSKIAPTNPPVKDYESSAIASLTYDRSPGGDANNKPDAQELQQTNDAGSKTGTGWYWDIGKNEYTVTTEGDSQTKEEYSPGDYEGSYYRNEGWDFDSYYRNDHSRSSASMRMSHFWLMLICVGFFG